ncbi:MAG: hypothetical protein K0B15_13815 [Lentimicrobium sp.]|nr:hypothetical protein [Lentimicrobium sp.]
MKKFVKLLPVFLLSALLFLSSAQLFAQGPPPPPPGGHALDGNQPQSGGTAPIGSGMAILLVMGAAYAGKKAYDARISE